MIVGVQGGQPQQPAPEPGRNGRPCSRYEAQGTKPWAIEHLVREFPKEPWNTVSWREGSKGEQSSRLAAVRVHTAERHVHGVPPSEQVWRVVQWPEGEKAPSKYALCKPSALDAA